MFGRMSRGLCVAVLALAISGWAAAQEPKKPEAKPEAKPEVKKPEAAPQAEGKDILATAADAKLATFVDLVKLAGLTDDLKKPGLTVFAPTDDAFKAYKGLDDLKKDKAKLADFLKGHVVAKKIEKGDKTAKSLAGTEIKLTPKEGKCMVNDKIACTKELTASNGMIHVIDAVIAPAAAEKKPEAKPEVKKEEPKKEPAKPEAKKEEPKKPEPKKEGEKPAPKPGEKKG